MTRIPTLGVLLAGGLARRLGGGDKAMRIVGGRTLLARVIERVTPQCDALILNANGDPSRLAQFDLPVVADTIEGHAGPLAGVLAALDWCADNRPATAWVLSVATDCPFLPHDLAARLHDAIASSNARFAAAASGGQTHHTIGLWPVDARAELRHALAVEGLRKISAWTARYRLATVEWPMTPVDPFFNANTEDEIVTAEQLARRE